jgi:hypothetical protein
VLHLPSAQELVLELLLVQELVLEPVPALPPSYSLLQR